ncbi:MAG: hypothetical protein OXH75_01190 [Acidobacteria bacterium]|nr:hypothetical protein [Acidobacteriota bacterium]
MSAADVRAAVDGAIRRHLEARSPSPPPVPGTPPGAAPPEHPSHARFTVPDGAAAGGRCVIEPRVACVHSGHCQAQGY